MSTPANGPMTEYGGYSTVNAAAAADGLGNELALKNTYVPTPAVTMPSPAWEISRTENSRRKSRSASTLRRSARREARGTRSAYARWGRPACRPGATGAPGGSGGRSPGRYRLPRILRSFERGRARGAYRREIF